MRILSALALTGLLAMPGAAAPSSAQELLRLLEGRRITVEFKGASMDDVVKYVRAATGINIVVDKRAIEKEGGDVEAYEFEMEVRNVSVRDFLKLAFEPQDLGLAIRKNILLITSKKAARGKPVLRMYDIAHLLVQIRDFPAPEINLFPSDYEYPEPDEPEIHQAVESSDEVAELVRNFTGQDTWEDEGIRLNVFRRHLFIRQYPHVHRQIGRFLLQLNALR